MLGDSIIGEYKRVTPIRFADDTDDIFMRSMIEQYSLEQKTKKGFPSGNFWMNEATTRAAAAEVLETHKGLKASELGEYMGKYFGKAWNHFDVNRTGFVEVIKMPQFMRFLASDQYMSLQPWTAWHHLWCTCSLLSDVHIGAFWRYLRKSSYFY